MCGDLCGMRRSSSFASGLRAVTVVASTGAAAGCGTDVFWAAIRALDLDPMEPLEPPGEQT
eukprot:952032-Rhodomonas_salina.1